MLRFTEIKEGTLQNCKYQREGLRNQIDDTQGASAHDVMPLMKSCLLPCQQDRCRRSPLIQNYPIHWKRLPTTLPSLKSNAIQEQQCDTHCQKNRMLFRQFKSQSPYDCLMAEAAWLFSPLKNRWPETGSPKCIQLQTDLHLFCFLAFV